jgi:signal transduction histidine kinase
MRKSVPINLIQDDEPRSLTLEKSMTNPPETGRKAGPEVRRRFPFSKQVRPARQRGVIVSANRLPDDFAHQLNNLLTVILGHTEFLLKREESPEISRLRVEEIRNAAERGVQLTSQLLKKTRKPHLDQARRT